MTLTLVVAIRFMEVIEGWIAHFIWTGETRSMNCPNAKIIDLTLYYKKYFYYKL
jgi:hypothetical protein